MARSDGWQVEKIKHSMLFGANYSFQYVDAAKISHALSILLPAYNGTRFIDEQLRSLFEPFGEPGDSLVSELFEFVGPPIRGRS